jgi:hypothetical protein
VVGGKWVGSHGPVSGGSLRLSSRPLEHWPGVSEGCCPGRVEIVSACGSQAWQALGSWSWQ